MSRPDPDSVQRRAIRPASSVWVAASAGTGKTKVLTDRVLALLLAGTAPERILCLTFTKAAAAEMANRITAQLAGWTTASELDLDHALTPLMGAPPDAAGRGRARQLFARLLDNDMRIETIHAFCQSLLRRFPLEAGLAPHFQVMDERDAGELVADAREEMLATADPDLLAALAVVTATLHEQRFAEVMAEFTREPGRLRHLSAWSGDTLAEGARALRRRLGVLPDDSAARLQEEAERGIDRLAARPVALALLDGTESDRRRGAILLRGLEQQIDLESWRSVFLTLDDTIRDRLCGKEVEAARPGARAWLQTEAERLFALRQRERGLAGIDLTLALLRLALSLGDRIQARKDARALLDYDDLIARSAALLTQDGGAAWVLYKLDGGIDHLLIDEAQDTNPDQWAVIRALTLEFFAGHGRSAAGSRTVFAVGDAKQSIYSFQRADPREFEASRQSLAARVPIAGGQWDEIALDTSFRSVAAVLTVVDRLLAGEGGSGVVPSGQSIRHQLWRQGAGGAVELWAPVVPRPADQDAAWKPPVERREGDNPPARLARLLAERIRQMVETPEMLESKGRPIVPGDILVLVRRRNRFVDHLVRSLKRAGVAVAGADRMVLTEQLAVMDLMALAQVLLLPEDDLTLAVVLKGPLIGLSEEQLFTLAWDRPGSLWQALAQSRFTDATAYLTSLAARVDYCTPHDLFSHVLNKGGRRQLLARLGPEALDPLDEFISLCLLYEQLHPPSLQGFLHWLEQGGTEIKRDLDQGGDVIRIMTVHGAKGLQAPIVFLPDTLQKPKKRAGLIWLEDGERPALPLWPSKGGLNAAGEEAQQAARDANDAEYRRLLYVAMTRAEDRLIVCGWNTRQKAPEDCWYHLIERSLQGIAEQALHPFLATQGHDARYLRLATPQTAAVEAAVGGELLRKAAPLPAWARQPAPAEPPPADRLIPSRPQATPIFATPSGGKESRARRRGGLIHRLLQILPDLPADERAAAAARLLGRPAWELSYAEQAEIAGEVARVMTDQRFAPLFGPDSRAEVPLIGRLGKRVVSGRVDRLLVRPDQVLVVDYKTDRRPPATPPVAYVRQMAAYRGLLACLYSGRPVRCALLWTDQPAWMTLETALLDDSLARMASDA